jgi:hypothetical protein
MADYIVRPLLHTFHAISIVERRVQPRKANVNLPLVSHEARCDKCRQSIIGVRYKVRTGKPTRVSLCSLDITQCTHPACPDYDLCEDCEALPGAHPPTHVMYKIRRGMVLARPSTDPSWQGRIYCDNCSEPIRGIRYKVCRPCPVCRTWLTSRRSARTHPVPILTSADHVDDCRFPPTRILTSWPSWSPRAWTLGSVLRSKRPHLGS